MAPRQATGSGHRFGQAPDMETQQSAPNSAFASTLPLASASASASTPAATTAPASSPLQRPSLSVSASLSLSAAAASVVSSTVARRRASNRDPRFVPVSSSTSSSTAATAASSASSSPVLRSILPPLPPQGPSPPGRSSSPRNHSHLHSSISASAASASSSPLTLSSLDRQLLDLHRSNNLNNLNRPDTVSSPFPPILLGPQSSAFWSAYRNQLDRSSESPQDDSAANNIGIAAAQAFGLNLAVGNRRPGYTATYTYTPFTSQPPFLQSPSQPPRRPSPDLHFPFDLGVFPASPSSSDQPSSAAASSASLSTSAAPAAASTSSRHHQSRATTSLTNRNLSATHNPASSPVVDRTSDAFRHFAETTFGATLDSFFDEFEGASDFPEDIDTSFSSTSDIMPAASTARRRTLRSQAADAENHDNATATTNANKRRRVMRSAAEPTSLRSVADDEDESLFGSSPSRPGSSSGFKSEDYTTIDLTEATDVPDELKKPVVDTRVKMSAFQCVICMDDVTGLTLTHCGHLFCAQCLYSSLSIESTRGKCPMCRAKIDMKARENYSSKTKGYWPLELKLMTRTRQGKRKAQAMA